MLRKILISCILLTSLFFAIRMCYPAPKELDHIYELKLGMSKQELQNLDISSPIPMKLTSENYIQRIKNTNAFEKELMNENRVEAFSLDYYASPNNEIINEIELYFIDNKLYRIRTSVFNAEVEEWLNKEEAIVLNKRYKEPDKIDAEQILQEYAANWEEGVTLRSFDFKWDTNIDKISCQSNFGLNKDGKILYYQLILVDEQLAGMAKTEVLSSNEGIK